LMQAFTFRQTKYSSLKGTWSIHRNCRRN
jgi:hypothetical protein